MPRVLPLQRPIRTTLAVAILGALLVALGFAAVGVAIVLVFGFLYPSSLFLFGCLARSRPVRIEGDTLVQRNSQGRCVASIDSKRPFVATYLFEDDHHAYYRVRQQRTVLRLAVPRRGDGQLVRFLQLPWPPAGPRLGGYL